ncbi:hypothetical protein Taro_029659 [Colocasia esculenta]|uniref:Uncharacterized protein n=1 Tax=Colocasia esculenta TaxID=4460 RepID=A0A843VPP0_COLES|nr:hypothetical protein [Colocasia esculenta]
MQDDAPENDIQPSDEAFQDNLIDVPIRGEIQDVDLCQESSMASTGERSSHDGSRPRRLRTLSVPLPPTSQAVPPPPTSQGLPPATTSQQLPLPLTLQQTAPTSNPQGSSAASASSVHLHDLGGGVMAVEGRLGELRRGDALMDNNGMSPLSEAMASALLQITLLVAWVLYQRYILTYQWERTHQTDKEMLAHMSAMHRSWRSKQKKKNDAIASVPAGVDPADWQTMCELWTTGDEREAMSEIIAPSAVDAESQTIPTPEDAFISVMGKDRPGRVRCAGSGETLRTWYGSTSTGPSAYSERERKMQEQLKIQEEKLKAQADKMNQMQDQISQLQSVASKVDEMSVLLSQIQASHVRTQPVPVPPPVQSESDSETDEAADDYLDHDVHVS